MRLIELNESIKQYEIDKLIMNIRNNIIFYTENGLSGPKDFESGHCYEFALGLYNFLKSKGDIPELYFLIGNMKKADAEWFKTDEFDPAVEHPFHTIVKVRKFYYDINGRLGNKREIKAEWSYFRNKKIVKVEPNDVLKYTKKRKLIKSVEKQFQSIYN